MLLKPSNIFYSQNQISYVFGKWNRHRSTTIGETLDDLCEGRCRISDIEQIKVTKKDNKWCTLDNRRLWLFHHLEAAGKCTEIPVVEVTYCPSLHSRKFSSNDGGKSVKVIRGSPGGKWHRRITPVTPKIQEVGEQIELKCKDTDEHKNEDPGDGSHTESVTSRLEEREKEVETPKTGDTILVIKENNDKVSIKQQSSTKEDTDSTDRPSTGIEIKQEPIKAIVSRNIDTAVVNRKEWLKRLFDIRTRQPLHVLYGAYTAKSKNECQKSERFQPYHSHSNGQLFSRHKGSIYSRQSYYDRQFIAKTNSGSVRLRKLALFSGCETYNDDSDTSEDDFEEEELLADEEINKDNEIDKTCSDDDIDSKEIDYDDDPWSDDNSNCQTLELDYDERDVWESDSDELMLYYNFPESDSDTEEEVSSSSDSDTEEELSSISDSNSEDDVLCRGLS